MKISICVSNLEAYLEGKEEERWLYLPMEPGKLKSEYNEIPGKNHESIILEYEAPFDISEYENIFQLNNFAEELKKSGMDEELLTALFKADSDREKVMESIKNDAFCVINVNEVSKDWATSLDREELFGYVLNEEGYNDLFSHPIPEEMKDYMDFSQIYTCLSCNHGWRDVDVKDITYLVSFI